MDSTSIYNYTQETEESDQKKNYCCAETSQNDLYSSKWIFPIKIEWLSKFDAELYKKCLQDVKNQNVPIEPIFYPLPSVAINTLKKFDWFLESKLLKGKVSNLEFDKRNFSVKLVVCPKNKKEVDGIM